VSATFTVTRVTGFLAQEASNSETVRAIPSKDFIDDVSSAATVRIPVFELSRNPRCEFEAALERNHKTKLAEQSENNGDNQIGDRKDIFNRES